MSNKPSVLVVDDESGILDTLRILLRNEGFEVTTAQGGKAGLEQIRTGTHDIILSDVRMPQVSGLDILTAAREQDPMTPVILMTAQASLQSAIGAVNSGAFYYIQKPFGNDELVAILRRACEFRAVRVENKQLKQEIRRRDKSTVTRPIGKSKRFIELLKLAEHVAPTDSTVLIQGESGTGKEVVARYVHNLSNRTEGPFLSINCGALPENLLESELFGHVKGSFTGAVRDKQGLFAAARGGSFFLDEVGEMPPSLQVKLLRVLQEREAIPVGATEAIPVDVRIIAATNRDLEEEIRRGNFRSDLFYRLNVIALNLPPLRDRRDDLLLLIENFLQQPGDRGRDRAEGARVGGARRGDGLRVAGQRPRAGERPGARHRPQPGQPDRGSVAAGADHQAAEGAAGRRAVLPESHARGDRARLHHVGAPGRGRQQDPGGRGAGDRPLDAVPQAQPVRGAGGGESLAALGRGAPERSDGGMSRLMPRRCARVPPRRACRRLDTHPPQFSALARRITDPDLGHPHSPSFCPRRGRRRHPVAPAGGSAAVAHPLGRTMPNRKGFTLIELLIVVVIIGILASIAIPKFASTKEKAYLAAMKSDLRNGATARKATSPITRPTSAERHQRGGCGHPAGGAGQLHPVARGDHHLHRPAGTGWSAVTTHSATTKTCAIFIGVARWRPPRSTASPGARNGGLSVVPSGADGDWPPHSRTGSGSPRPLRSGDANRSLPRRQPRRSAVRTYASSSAERRSPRAADAERR